MPSSPGAVRGAHLRGIALVTAAFCVLPALDGIAKYLIVDHHVAQLVWARMLFQTLVVAVWFAASRRSRLQPVRRPLLLLGSVTLVWLANFPIIWSLAYLPLASAFALIMTAPLLLTALSAPLLGERVGPHRWLAVVAGFAGALVIIRPGFSVFHWAAVLPVLSAVFFVLYQLGVRTLARDHGPLEILLYSSVAPLLASSVLVPFFWVPPQAGSWLLMAMMGAGAGLAHFMLISALRHAPASLLAPFMYVQLVSSAVIGWVVWTDVPDWPTLAGMGIIVAAGLHGMRREADA